MQNDTFPHDLEAPKQSYALLRRFIPKSLQPAIRGLSKRWKKSRKGLPEPYWSVFPYTQVSMAKQENLIRLGELLERNAIPGAIVECGVLDGGCSALMAFATSSSGRQVHMFDSWEGLPPTTEEDGEESSKWEGECVGSQGRVRAVMASLQIDPARLNFHQGWFHDTFPEVDIPAIAMLHIDCDFYEPTRLCLEKWYRCLSPGGFIQIDDYDCFLGSQKATDEFLAGFPGMKLKMHRRAKGGQAYYFEKPLAALPMPEIDGAAAVA